jgi:hypothetical protein
MFLGKLWLRIKGEILTLKEDLTAPSEISALEGQDERQPEGRDGFRGSFESSALGPGTEYAKRPSTPAVEASAAPRVATRRSLGGIEAPPEPAEHGPCKDGGDPEDNEESGHRRVLG